MSANGLHRVRWRLFAVARVVYRIRQVPVARDLVNIQQSRVPEEGLENVGKRTPSKRRQLDSGRVYWTCVPPPPPGTEDPQKCSTIPSSRLDVLHPADIFNPESCTSFCFEVLNTCLRKPLSNRNKVPRPCGCCFCLRIRKTETQFLSSPILDPALLCLVLFTRKTIHCRYES